MERFFIVKNENLIKQVKEFESMRIKFRDTFGEFKKKHGIETSRFYQYATLAKLKELKGE